MLLKISYLPGMDFFMSHEVDVFGLWIVPDVLERLSVIHPCVVDGILEGIVEDWGRYRMIILVFSSDFEENIGIGNDFLSVDFFCFPVSYRFKLIHLTFVGEEEGLVHLPMDDFLVIELFPGLFLFPGVCEISAEHSLSFLFV